MDSFSNLCHETQRAALEALTRRRFLSDAATGMGALWLASQSAAAHSKHPSDHQQPLQPAKVKRVVFLHLEGAPSQLELFDYKPELKRFDGKECPKHLLDGQRFAFIRGTPKLLGPQYAFKQHGQCGAWISDRLPHLAQHADQLCFVKTLQTDQFNHAPAQLMVHTGQPRLGYPSIGSWVTWGLGSDNDNLPGFMVLLSGGRFPRVGSAIWSSGFLPSVYQGIQCRSQGDPVLDIANPANISADERRAMLDVLQKLNKQSYQELGNPETLTRIAQYEMAFRMQSEVPEVMSIDDEPSYIHQMYGTEPGKESLANNCLLARRLLERGVRFVQLFDWGWDSHGSTEDEAINMGFAQKCREMDQPVAALLSDLQQRGMLDDTLVVWGGEFGRTSMQENRNGGEMRYIGRDHNPNTFTWWLAGGGVKPGTTIGETDPLGYSPVTKPIQLRDIHATILHLLGIDPHRFTFHHQGLRQKLTGVKPSRVVKEILA